MTEHTPGPWKAEGTCPQEGWDGWWVKDAEGNHIAEATGYQADETRQANAYLIAAAPDLLAACEAALFYIEEGDGVFSGPDEALIYAGKTAKELRDAIAKANGCER